MSDSNTTESDMSVEQGQAGGQEHAPTGEIIDQQTDNGFAPESDSNVQPEREPQFTPVAQLQPAFEGNISFASVGGTAAKRQQSGEPAPAPAPGTGREPGKHGLRNFIVGGGVVGTVGALATAAAITMFGGRGSSDQQHNPDTGANGGAPTLTIKTPEATQTPTVTPEKTPKKINIFMPELERREIAGTTFVIDPDLATVTECPSSKFINQKDKCEQLHEIVPNSTEIPNIEELKKEVDDKILMTAWLKLEKGMTDSQIAANMDGLLADYRANKGRIDHSFSIVGFGDADNYISETNLTIDDTYKIEPLLVALPNKYTPIELTSSYKAGFVVNSDTKTLYFVMYDHGRWGVNQIEPTTDRSKYNLAYGYELTGNLLSEKPAQLSHKISLSDINKMLPVTKEFSKSLIPIQNGDDWHSVWYVR